MTKTRWIVTAMLMLAAAGCQKTLPDSKAEALKRWDQTRAQMVFGVAQELFHSGQLERAAAKTIEALSLDENYTPARLLLGKVYIEQGHFTQAVVELKRAVAEWPNASEPLYDLGVAQEKAGQLDEALASYRRAQALDSTSLSAVTAAAEVMVAMGNVADARIYLDHYMAAAGADPAMYELAGRLAAMSDDHRQAVNFLQQALDLDPNNLRYRESLGRSQFHANLYAETLETLRPLLAKPRYTCPVWVHTMMGDCLMAQGRAAEARDCYHLAKDLDPQACGAWTNLAKAALAAGDTPRAILAAQQAMSLDGNSLDAAILLGYALLRDGQLEQAQSVLGAAAVRHADKAIVHCLLGRAYAADGKAAQAEQCYQKALKIDPSDALARELAAANKPGGTKVE